jgi:hypothetical protein
MCRRLLQVHYHQMESDAFCHDRFHYNQYGRYDCLDHCPTKWLHPSRLVHRFQPHASFCCRQSSHILDVVSEFRWINQEIIHLRSDLYAIFPLCDVELINSHGMGKR